MYWLLIARDRPGTEKIRAVTREEHRSYIWRDDLPAKLLLGSPIASTADGTGMQGSWLLLSASCLADVEAFAARDPYSLANLFESTEILPVHEGFDPAAQLAKQPVTPLYRKVK